MLSKRLLPLALVAGLGACAPSPPETMEAETASYRVELDLDAAAMGQRSASVQLTDAGRRPADIDKVVVTSVMQKMDMTGASVVADEVEAGRFKATGAFFTMPGNWALTVRVEGAGFDEEATFKVEAEP